MRVKFIAKRSIIELEKEVNDWLSSKRVIFDIQYKIADSYEKYTVMIRYDEE